MTEQYRPKFRPGEHEGKPIGGDVSQDPFAHEFYELFKSRGLESQYGIAQAMGKPKEHKNSGVRMWVVGKYLPTRQKLEEALYVLNASPEERERIEALYIESQSQRRRGGKPVGGNISSYNFPQELYSLFKSRGLESQVSIGKVLSTPGHNVNMEVRRWLLGLALPSEKNLENVFLAVDASPEDRERIETLYREGLSRRGKAGRKPITAR